MGLLPFLVDSKAHAYEYENSHQNHDLLGLCAVMIYSQLTITLAVSDGTIVRVVTSAFCR